MNIIKKVRLLQSKGFGFPNPLRVNKAGKQLFRIDADITHLWHLHYGATSALMRVHRTGIALYSYLGIANGLKGIFSGF